MTNKNMNFFAKKLTNAFLNDKIIKPIPKKYTNKLTIANSFRKLCESKIKKPIIGFKAVATAAPSSITRGSNAWISFLLI